MYYSFELFAPRGQGTGQLIIRDIMCRLLLHHEQEVSLVSRDATSATTSPRRETLPDATEHGSTVTEFRGVHMLFIGMC